MASSFDDIIKVLKGIEGAIKTQADDDRRQRDAERLDAEIKADQDRAAAQAKRVENAQKELAVQKEKLKDLQEEDSRLQKINKLLGTSSQRLEDQQASRKRLNDLAIEELKTKQKQLELERESVDKGADPQKYKELTDAMADLDAQMALKNRTAEKELAILSMNTKGYQESIQFIQESALVYGKHSFANVGMLLSFKNLVGAMNNANVMFEIVRAGIGSLINTMFAFTMSIDTETHAIMRNTGASLDNAKAMQANAQELAYFGVEAKEVTESVTSLRSQFQDFTFFTVDTQKEIKNTSVLLNDLGVSFNDSSRAMQNMAVTMGINGAATAAAARDLTDFAHVIQVIPSELMSNFAAAGDSLAKFGDEGISSFKELAIRSKVTTLEVEKMLRMVEKFDTFEGAAEQAGKLNAALGGNFVNAMDLMMTTNPAERFDMIRDAILNTGLSFDDMSYYQRKFFTEAANLDSVADLAKVMRGDFSGMAGDVMKSSDEFEKLAERTKAVQSVQEKFKTLLMSMIPVFEPLIHNLNLLLQDMSTEEFNAIAEDIMSSVSMIAKVLVAIIPHLDTIVILMGTKGLFSLVGGVALKFKLMRQVFGNVTGVIAGLGQGISNLGGKLVNMVKNFRGGSAAAGAMIGPIQDLSSTASDLAEGGSDAAGAVDNLSGSMQRNAPAAKGAGKGLVQVGVAAALMGVGIGAAAFGVSYLVDSFMGLGDAAYPAALGILAFGGALALFMFGMKLLLPVIAAGSVGLGLFTSVVVVLAAAFAGMALATAKAASSIGEMFKAMSANSMDDFKEVMGYFTTGTDGISKGITTVTENIDLLVKSINSISADNITALGDAMTAVSAAASIETTALKNDIKDIMSSINEVSLPKINATTALIGAVGGAATATAADPMAGFDRRRSTGEKPVVKVYIGDTELKQTIRTVVNGRLAELGVTD